MKELDSDNDNGHGDEMDKDLLELEKEGLDDISHEDISGTDIKMVINSLVYFSLC